MGQARHLAKTKIPKSFSGLSMSLIPAVSPDQPLCAPLSIAHHRTLPAFHSGLSLSAPG